MSASLGVFMFYPQDPSIVVHFLYKDKISTKMCSSLAFTHITALFRISGQPQIIIQLKQFSASICQIDLIRHSNDTNGVSLFLSPSPSEALFLCITQQAVCNTEENRESRLRCICLAGCLAAFITTRGAARKQGGSFDCWFKLTLG